VWNDTKAAAHLQHPTPGSTPMHFPSPPCPSSPAPPPPPLSPREEVPYTHCKCGAMIVSMRPPH
jgi:hypothetical protein